MLNEVKHEGLIIQRYFSVAGFRDQVRGLAPLDNAIRHAKDFAKFHALVPGVSTRLISRDTKGEHIEWPKPE